MIAPRALIVVAALCAVACKSKPNAAEAGKDAAAVVSAPADGAAPPPVDAPAAPAAPPEPKVVMEGESGDGRNLEQIAATGEHLYWVDTSMHGYRDSRLFHSVAGGQPEDSEAHSSALAVDADYVYIVRDDAVVRRPHAGGDFEKVAALAPAQAMTVAAGVVYGVNWTTVPDTKGTRKDRFELWRAATDGKPKRLYASDDRLGSLAVHGDRLYMTEGRKVVSMKLDGKDVKTVVDKDAVAFAPDEAGVYVGLASSGALSTVLVPSVGGTAEIISTEYAVIAADATRLFAARADGSLVAVDKKTKAVTSLWQPPAQTAATGVALGAGALYVKRYPDGILSIPLP